MMIIVLRNELHVVDEPQFPVNDSQRHGIRSSVEPIRSPLATRHRPMHRIGRMHGGEAMTRSRHHPARLEDHATRRHEATTRCDEATERSDEAIE